VRHATSSFTLRWSFHQRSENCPWLSWTSFFSAMRAMGRARQIAVASLAVGTTAGIVAAELPI
jgi:hypothetical protein